MKDRDLSLDVIRVLACVLVVLMHSPLPSANANGPFLAALSFFTAPCIGLFFMVSGALLLPVRMDYFTFIRKRLSKVLVPTILWTFIYLALKLYFSGSEIDMLHVLASVPFSAQGNGVLWFMYTLAGLYLLAPIQSAWVQGATDREIKFVLLLWAVTLCYPLLSFYVDVDTSTTGLFYYFTGYAGYFLLGYALKSGRIRIPLALTVLVVITGIGMLLLLKRFDIEFDFYSLFWYESVFIVSLCVLYWHFFSWVCARASVSTIKSIAGGGILHITSVLSNLSFGVYLVHIMIMRHWLWNMSLITSINNYYLQTFVVAILTFVVSIIICTLISKFRVAKWFIGYSTKK